MGNRIVVGFSNVERRVRAALAKSRNRGVFSFWSFSSYCLLAGIQAHSRNLFNTFLLFCGYQGR